MIQTDCYYLPAKAANDLLKRDLKKLSPVVTGDGPPRGFRLIDTFDGEVRKSGRLLFSTGDALELISTDTGPLRQPSETDTGYVAELDAGVVKNALSAVSPLRVLQAIGEGDMQDVALAFVDSAEKTRVRAQLWLLRSNAGGSAALVTLQGLRGYDKALDQVRAHLTNAGATQISDGAVYTSLFPTQALYTAKPEVAVGRDEAAFDAANHIIATYLPISRVNEPGIIADVDIEFLHDYRIALRKIRSVLSLFAGVYDEKTTIDLKSRFSALMSETGQLRDLDVYLADKEHFYSLLPQSLHAGLDALFELFSDRRAAEHSRLSQHLRSAAYTQEMEALAARFGKKKKKLRKGENADLSALEYSRDLIWTRYRKVCKIASGIDDRTHDDEVHRLRIHCKKLRYLMEFFGPVFPKKEFNSLLRPLKRLQDNLGLFNDYSVQQDSLRALLEELNSDPGRTNLEIAQSVGALIVVLHRKQLEERAKVVASFARFNDERTKGTFRTLFKTGKSKS